MRTFSLRSCLAIVAVLALALAGCVSNPPAETKTVPASAIGPAEASPAAIPAREISTRALADGGSLALHRVVLRPAAAGIESRVVLLLHPIDIPGAAAFKVKGYSLMDYLADRGYDVWAVDYRGFGRSSAASEEFDSKRQRVPTPRLDDALDDVREAIAAVLSSTGASSLSLVGYGYGGIVAGATAEKMPDKVSRLVLYGTSFAFKIGKVGTQLGKLPLESKPGVLNAKLPIEQSVDWENATLAQWQKMMAGKPLAESEAFAAAAEAFYATDYLDPANDRRTVRRPTGPLLDMYRAWSNKPLFNAGKIKVPTLIVRGELDAYADPDLSKQLTGSKIVREVVVKNATHWMLYEKAHDQVFAETDRFLAGR
jgi:pimeloyl-ACP methyl ester carboxylesterase